MSLGVVLWVLALLCHGLALACVVGELFWEYRFPAWIVAWGSVGAALALSALWRGIVFWQNQDRALAFLLLEGSLLLSISLLYLYGFWCLATIFHQGFPDQPPSLAHIVIDQDSRILAWDTAAALMFGWATDEAVGQTLMQTIIPVRSWDAHLAAVGRYLQAHGQRHDTARTMLMIGRHKDGHEFPVEITIAVTLLASGAFQFHGAIRRLVVL